MSKGKGWLALARSIEDWDYYPTKEGRKFTHFEAWLDLLVTATYRTRTRKGVVLYPGQLLVTVDELSARWGRSGNWISAFFMVLKNQEQLVCEKVPKKGTLITLVNWDKYQVAGDLKEVEIDEQKSGQKGGTTILERNKVNKGGGPSRAPAPPQNGKKQDDKELRFRLWHERCELEKQLGMETAHDLTGRLNPYIDAKLAWFDGGKQGPEPSIDDYGGPVETQPSRHDRHDDQDDYQGGSQGDEQPDGDQEDYQARKLAWINAGCKGPQPVKPQGGEA